MRVPAAARMLPSALTLAAMLGCAHTGPTDPVRMEVEAAWKKWRQAGLANYRYVSSVDCYCAPEYTRPMVVTVTNGQVTSVADSATGAAQPVSIRQPVDSMFANLFRVTGGDPSQVDALFDATYGYPVRVSVGSLAADAGYVVYVSSLQPLL